MRLGFGKRILALGLSIALCVSDAVPAFAEDALENEIVAEQTIDASELNDFTEETVETESESKETEALAEEISEEVSDEEASETVETVEESETEETVEATEEEAEEVEITDEEAPLADAAEPVTYTVELDDVTVTVTLTNKDDIPADAVLTVEPVSVSDAMESAVESALDSDEESVSAIVAYDISFVNPDGSEAEPKNPVTVSIVSNSVDEGTSVFHYADNGTVEDMDAEVCEGEAVFETGHFSTYVVANIAKAKNYTATTTVITTGKYCSVNSSVDGYQYNYTSSQWANLQVKVYVDNNLKATYPDDDAYFLIFGGDNDTVSSTFTISDVMAGYNLSAVKYENASDWNPQNATVSNNSTSFGMSLTVAYDGLVFHHSRSNVICIYLTTCETSKGSLRLYNYNISKINSGKTLQFMTSAKSGSGVNQYVGSGANDSKVHAGIVNNVLTSGYPTLASNNESLSYLFDVHSDGVISFNENATGLFTKDTDGYYYFDSAEKGASLDLDTGEFDLTDAGKGYFGPFGTSTNENKFSFGLVYETNFIQPKDGKISDENMIFEFSGDDDVWVFIDDVLVLDIGGIHGKTGGSIDFSTGTVVRPTAAYVGSNEQENPTYSTTVDLRSLFEAASASTSSFKTGTNTFSDYTQHTMKVFYFERGGVKSNFKIKFNLQEIPTGTIAVSKTVTGKENDETEYSFKVIKNGSEVVKNTTFDIYEAGKDSGIDGTIDENGVFKLKNGQSAYISGLSVTDTYVVQELNVSADQVKVNGTKTNKDSDKNVSSLSDTVANRAAVTFENIYSSSSDLTLNKTAEVSNYENRIYKIDLSADYNGTRVVESEKEEVEDADVILVFDTSGSMIYTDAVIVSESTSSAAYAKMLSTLDTSKIYFTKKSSDYTSFRISSGETAEVKNRLLSTAISGGRCYNIPYGGEYLFYADGNWYKRSVISGDNYVLNDSNALDENNSSAKKITSSNCPTTIYTNRSEMLVRAAKSFVDDLSAGSRVALITFGNEGDSETLIGLTKIETGKSEIDAKIESATGVYNTATFPTEAIEKATNIYTADTITENENYVVFFADGNIGKGNGQGESTSSLLTKLKTKADLLKNKATVYAIGIGDSEDTLKTVATDDDHVISASAAADLTSVFNSISTSIVSSTQAFTGKGIVTDYIDSRFVVTDASGNVLSNGASVDSKGGVLHITDDATYVEWSGTDGLGVEIGHAGNTVGAWSSSIYVKAKDTFFGGNAIPTNGAASGVQMIGDMEKKFPQPTVNVKLLDYSVSDNDTTVFLGDESTPLAYITLENAGIEATNDTIENTVKLTSDELSSLVAEYNDGDETYSITKDYVWGTEDVIGTFVYTLAAKDNSTDTAFETVANHTVTKTMDDVEDYTLTISYVPKTVSERLEGKSNLVAPTANGGTAVTEINGKQGKFTVNVVDGTIRVVKVIDIGKVEWTDGDPIFTFEITNNATGKTITKIAHFKKADFEGKTGEFHVEIAFTGLAKGSYTVRELNTLGYTLESISNEVTFGDFTGTYTNVTILNEPTASATATLGTTINETLAAVQMKNTKLSEYFMDRDEVTNSVSKDASGNITITTSRTTEERKTFATKEELDAYVNSKKTTVAGGNN